MGEVRRADGQITLSLKGEERGVRYKVYTGYF